MQDIADHIGCGETTVYCFMKKNNIPTKDHSEARLEVWKWENKKNAILEGMHTDKYRNKKRCQTSNLWKDSTYRKKTVDSNIKLWTEERREQNKRQLEEIRHQINFILKDVIRKYLIEEKTIADIARDYNCTVSPVYKYFQRNKIPKVGKIQKKVLNLLYKYKSINISRLIKLMESIHKVKRDTTYATIRKLVNKKLINRSKEFGDGKAEIFLDQSGKKLFELV